MNTSSSTPTSSPVTLESIIRQKEAVKKELEEQKIVLAALGKKVTAPFAPNPATKTNGVMRAFNTGMVTFQGIMIAIRVIRRFRKFFR